MTRMFAALAIALMVSACGSGGGPRCIAAGTNPLVWVPGGSFTMGQDARLPEEGPPQSIAVAGFWMNAHEVTNAEFARFVAATGYRTVAERKPPPLEGAPPEMLEPGSAVFKTPTPDNPQWWRWAPGAQWRHPAGPGSGTKDAEPVVQIAYDDAAAYARWAGLALPTEQQWEYAARGGRTDAETLVETAATPVANTWQGDFPAADRGGDGYRGRAPVGCFDANRFGLYDMIGNVWEWTRTADPRAPGTFTIKGGSFLCAANYCARYRPSARQFQEQGLGTDHIGFRLVDPNRLPPPGQTK